MQLFILFFFHFAKTVDGEISANPISTVPVVVQIAESRGNIYAYYSTTRAYYIH